MRYRPDGRVIMSGWPRWSSSILLWFWRPP